jgi:hypothetical protein
MRRGQEILNWLWLILALLVVGALQVVGSVSHPAQLPLDPASAQPNGALALNLWLRRLGYRVQAGVSPSITAASWHSRDTLVLLAPEADPAPAIERSLAGWVRTGGRLVIIAGGSATPTLLSTFGVSLVAVPPAPVRLVQPLLTAPPVGRLVGRAQNVLTPVSAGIEVAGTSRGPAVLLERVGRGIVWIVSSPDLLANRGIARAGNRGLALNFAGPLGSRVALTVITPPLPPATSTNWLTDTIWGVVVLFGILVALLYRGLAGRRLGPPIEPPATSFRPGVEYALSMAGLLRRGQNRAQALLPYQRSLQRRLRERGIDVLPAEMETILQTDENLTERELISRAVAIVEYEEELGRRHG